MTERFDEVLDEAGVLRELDAARAEAWVSGLVAEWGDLAELVARLRASDRAEAVDVLHALAAIEPLGADPAAGHPSGARAPVWARHIGTACAEQAWEIADPFSGNLSIVVEYAHDDDVRHSMLVELEDDLAVDIHFGPPGLVDDAFDESETRSLSVRPLEVVDALDRAAAALAATAACDDPPVTDEYVMNLPLAAARLAPVTGAARPAVVPAAAVAPAGSPDAAPVAPSRPPRDPADAEADAAACATLVAALARVRGAAVAPDALGRAAAHVRAALGRGDAPDLAALVEDTGVVPDDVDDATLLAALAGAFVVPGRLAAFGPVEREALRSLEWADWLGAVIPLVRDGVGGDASPEQLVRNINRCPEVTTTVPKRDIPLLAGIFARTLHAWELTGVVDDDGRLTAVGAWVLPRALLHAWGDPEVRGVSGR